MSEVTQTLTIRGASANLRQDLRKIAALLANRTPLSRSLAALGIGGPDSLTLSYLHQQQNDRPDVGIPFLRGSPAPVPRGVDFGRGKL